MTAASPPADPEPSSATTHRAARTCTKITQARRPHHYFRHPASPFPGPAAAATTAARDRHSETGDWRGSAGLPRYLVTPPASAASRRHPVGLLCAACVMITPDHGQSRTTGSLGVPADLEQPGEKGVIRPLPCA